MQYIIIALIAASVLSVGAATYYRNEYSSLAQEKAEAEMRNRLLSEQYEKEVKVQKERVEDINREYKDTITSIRNAYERMFVASQTILPANPSSPGGANQPTIRFDREPLDRAINDFRREIAKLTREGDECRAALNSTIQWGKEVVRSQQTTN